MHDRHRLFMRLPQISSVWRYGFIVFMLFVSLAAKAETATPPTAEIETRITNILASMSLQQKVGQMVQAEIKYLKPGDVATYGLGSVLNGGGSTPFNNKQATAADWVKLADAFYHASLKKTKGSAGIPIIWGTDAVHGHNNVFGATIFPHNIGLGAAKDPELIEAIATATAKEVAATGLDWIFAPTLAVVLDDRWGRSYEGYADRPEIVIDYAKAMVEGLQGRGKDFLHDGRMIATAKHFIGDGGTFRGKDQGDNRASEETLLGIHGAAYTDAIAAGVQTVMASFNSWKGEKLHGHRYLLTEVLKQRMNFDGFVISDWNGHGQIPGCSNAACPQAINAGIDMVMVPEQWKAFIANTIAAVEQGEIRESRIDDAVRRILRVKLRAGLFDQGAPSSRAYAGDQSVIGRAEHRRLAREAVRKSLVLLKNNMHTLPLNPTQKILVVGDAANDIGRQSGGWTLTWQGTDTTNADFPGATSIYQGLKNQVERAGGDIQLSVDGQYTDKPDAVILVYGETPYAEGVGDQQDLQYKSADKQHLALMRDFKQQGIPVVSVLITGRPLWQNAELNAADAFVVAWLPGSEGEGIADVLLADNKGQPQYDFTGQLSFDWPAVERNPRDQDAPVDDILFAYGYGLDYQQPHNLADNLNESPVQVVQSLDQVIFKNGNRPPFTAYVGDYKNWSLPVTGNRFTSAHGELSVRAVDRALQEDSRQLEWTGKRKRESQFYWKSPAPLDLTALAEAKGFVSMVLKIDQTPKTKVFYRMDCGYPCFGQLNLSPIFSQAPVDQWFRLSLPLACFAKSGADLTKIHAPFVIMTTKRFGITINEVALVENTNPGSVIACDG